MPSFFSRTGKPVIRTQTAFCSLLLCCLAWSVQAQNEDAALVEATEVLLAPLNETVRVSGSVHSRQTSNLSPRVEGVVAETPVEPGARIEKDDPVLRLDDTLARMEVERLEALLRQADTQYEDRQRVEAELSNLDSQHVSRTALATARAETQAAKANLDSIAAELKLQREILNRQVVRAPFDGMVRSRLVAIGEWVTASTPVLIFQELNTVYVDMYLPERFLDQIAPGSAVQIVSPSRPGLELSTQLTEVIPVIDDSTRTFLARVIYDNSELELTPGMAIEARIAKAGSGDPVLQVPADAIVRKVNGEINVWRVEENDEGLEVRPIAVTPGAAAGEMVEVQSGDLNEGDRVVTSGNESLRDGQAVRIW